MRAIGRQPQRAPDRAPLHCERHRPEQTTLNRLVQQHAASFIVHTEVSTGAALPRCIKGHGQLHAGRGRQQRAVVAHAQGGAAHGAREITCDEVEFAHE